MPTFAASQRGYENMWQAATVLPSYKARARAAANKIISLKSFYHDAEKTTGADWWWIGCIHYREGDNAPHACMANGDPAVGTGRRTVNVPAGRGPYDTFAESAVDALKYEGLLGAIKRIVSWYLWGAEKINGFVNARNSNYIWAGTTKMDPGMWVRDRVFDPSKNDPRPGVAAIMKELFAIDPTLDPDRSSVPSPVVVGGTATIPVVAGSVAIGDPAYAVGALIAVSAIVVSHLGAQYMPKMFINWRTSLGGLAAVLAAGIHQVYPQIPDLTPIATLIVGLLAKDAVVTGGTIKQ